MVVDLIFGVVAGLMHNLEVLMVFVLGAAGARGDLVAKIPMHLDVFRVGLDAQATPAVQAEVFGHAEELWRGRSDLDHNSLELPVLEVRLANGSIGTEFGEVRFVNEI